MIDYFIQSLHIKLNTKQYSLYTMHTCATSFDIRPNDVYACVADVGWITGHSYIVYGVSPILNSFLLLNFGTQFKILYYSHF